jgi:hypothetical protein
VWFVVRFFNQKEKEEKKEKEEEEEEEEEEKDYSKDYQYPSKSGEIALIEIIEQRSRNPQYQQRVQIAMFSA